MKHTHKNEIFLSFLVLLRSTHHHLPTSFELKLCECTEQRQDVHRLHHQVRRLSVRLLVRPTKTLFCTLCMFERDCCERRREPHALTHTRVCLQQRVAPNNISFEHVYRL